MKSLKERLNSPITIAILISIVYVISLIPVLYVARYIHPLADDYGFSAGVHHAISSGGSLFTVINAALQTVKRIYSSWQGTYSAIFVFAFQPGVFSDSMYALTPFIMIGLLTVSTICFYLFILNKLMGGRKSLAVIVSMFTLLMSVQFVPDKLEAFYWFNGSSYYTLFYAVSLFMIICVMQLMINHGKSRAVWGVLSTLLAIFIGGGNYTTALVCAEILFLFTVYAFYEHKDCRFWNIAVFVVFLISFAISMKAPGNAVRAASCDGMNPIKAIALSAYYSYLKIGEWTRVPQFVYIVIISPIMLSVTKDAKFEFKYPLIAIIVMLGLFASQMTPPLYAMSNMGSGRQIDIYYYAYYLLISGIVFYLAGWLNRRPYKVIDYSGLENLRSNYVLIALVMLGFVWISGALNNKYREMTSVSTAYSILDGTAAQYHAEYTEIYRILSSDELDVQVDDIKTVPSYLGKLGLEEDKSYWTNKQIADYYGKNSIVLKS